MLSKKNPSSYYPRTQTSVNEDIAHSLLENPPYSSPLPPSSCGPIDNEFLQFYADLHISSMMFSDPIFQHQLLFPFHPVSSLQQYKDDQDRKCRLHLNGTTVTSGNRISSMKKHTTQHHHHHHSIHNHSSSTNTAGAAASSSTDRYNNSSSNGAKRRVSFSKHGPRWNLFTPPPISKNQQQQRRYFDPRKTLPRRLETIEGEGSSTWSSEMEESDTTETEDTNCTSTLGEEEDTEIFVPLKSNNAGTHTDKSKSCSCQKCSLASVWWETDKKCFFSVYSK
jgi:hypothetical protein